MSLATFKKKTQSKYNNSSVGVSQFSLNGGHRNQGYIGQTSLSRSLSRTIAKGPYVKGYGGQTLLNTQSSSILSAVTSPENASVIKPSVLSSFGVLATKYRWIRRPQPITTIKSDTNRNFNTQSSYLNHKKKELQNDLKNECPESTKQSLSNQVSFSTINYTRMNHPTVCTYTKTIRFDTQSQGEYLESLTNNCIVSDISGIRLTNNSCALVR